ncbi:hypothetical protein BKA82DRAFT_4126208 [Pisolithus tinctorius]|nr:hypothetical protein BKA82DRAFT_4126208 [Pisolithus tinctorius]
MQEEQVPQATTPWQQMPQATTPWQQMPQATTPWQQMPQAATPWQQLFQASTPWQRKLALDKIEQETLKTGEELRLEEARFQSLLARFKETRESAMRTSCQTAAEAKKIWDSWSASPVMQRRGVRERSTKFLSDSSFLIMVAVVIITVYISGNMMVLIVGQSRRSSYLVESHLLNRWPSLFQCYVCPMHSSLFHGYITAVFFSKILLWFRQSKASYSAGLS